MEHVFLEASVLASIADLPASPPHFPVVFCRFSSPGPSCHVFVPTSSYSIWGSRENANKLTAKEGRRGTVYGAPTGRQAPCLMLYEPSLIGFSQEPHLVPVQLCHILAGWPWGKEVSSTLSFCFLGCKTELYQLVSVRVLDELVRVKCPPGVQYAHHQEWFGGNSLAVQWLKLHLPTQKGVLVHSPVGKIPHASWPKSQNIKQRQSCNKFNKPFKKSQHWKIFLEKKGALSIPLLMSLSEAFSAPFHCNKTSATQEKKNLFKKEWFLSRTACHTWYTVDPQLWASSSEKWDCLLLWGSENLQEADKLCTQKSPEPILGQTSISAPSLGLQRACGLPRGAGWATGSGSWVHTSLGSLPHRHRFPWERQLGPR